MIVHFFVSPMSSDSCSVKVVVRFRPINDRERKEGESRNYSVTITDEKLVELSGNPPFTFDRAFAPGSAQVRQFIGKIP